MDGAYKCRCKVKGIGGKIILNAQESAEDKPMMEKWMKYATPGESHKFLAQREGEWEFSGKMWMKPGAPATDSKGTAKGKVILGGRYLKFFHKSMIMGMPFEGIGIEGYDNHLEKFFSIWIDNMGTGILKSTGNLDKTGKILTDVGEMDDIMTGGKVKMRTIITIISKDEFSMIIYNTGSDGKEFKSLELVYTRKK